MNRLNIIGAGGHAAVVIETAIAMGFSIDRIFDADPNIETCLDYPVIHDLDLSQMDSLSNWFIGIGNNKTRELLSIKNALPYSTLVHPASVVSPSSELGSGTLVMPGAIVNARSHIGHQVILNTNCSVDHDCVIGDFAHISPGVNLAGNVMVGVGTQIGIGAVVLPGKRIGKWCMIGAGTVVLEDVPDGAVMVGNPGRIIE